VLAPRSWFHLPRRTVRLRLTALYGGLFLVSGAVLLAINYGLVVGVPIRASFAVRVGSAGGIGKAIALPSSKLCTLLPLPCPRSRTFIGPGPGAQGGGQVVGPGPGPTLKPPAAGILKAFEAVLPTANERGHLLAVSAVALGIMALISIGLGWLIAGRVLRPLRTMTTTTRHISEENLNERLALQGPGDELKDLGDTIDELLERLEKAFEAQRRFVANASHELRTPLAMMRTSVDVALGKPQAPAEVMVLAGKLEEGLDQAERLLEGLLVLARAQRGALGELTVVSLPDLVSTALISEQAEIRRLGLDVEDATFPSHVIGNETLLSRMVANVVTNAVRHNVPGGTVHISNDVVGPMERLVVESSGVFLDEATVRKLAEPFNRPGAERISNGNGAGLGLSIVSAIATAHGGSLQLRGRPAGGLRVEIELPAVVRV
jgi:signal transduction histidine kinase